MAGTRRAMASQNKPQPETFGAARFNLSDYSWQYRGEGNSSIVIFLPTERKVIRLAKCSRNDNQDDLDSWTRLQTNFLFVTSIMRPLLGSQFVSSPSLVYLSPHDVKLLNERLSSVRPENRKHKVLSFCGGELYYDSTFLPWEMSSFCQSKSVCIELKPKQGVMPPEEGDFRNCVFCCKQELKLRDGLVTQRGRYCPLDLFSGSLPRMKHAVLSLLNSPQNNLRIFYDGNLVFGDGHPTDSLPAVLSEWLHSVSGSDPIERFTNILLQALLKKVECPAEINRNIPETFLFDSTPQFDWRPVGVQKSIFSNMSLPPCNFEKQDLPEGCILKRLAQAQALDQWGTAMVHNMLTESKDFAKPEVRSSGTNYVQDILHKGLCSKLNPIELYLLAAAVRDCSILICFQELGGTDLKEDEVPQVEDSASNTRYVFRITAVDIGPKPVTCIESHHQKKVSICEACRPASQ